jgi:drug/metabolite transporter (DMT)-like permease
VFVVFVVFVGSIASRVMSFLLFAQKADRAHASREHAGMRSGQRRARRPRSPKKEEAEENSSVMCRANEKGPPEDAGSDRRQARQRARGLLFAFLAMLCFSPNALLTRHANTQRMPAEGESALGAPMVVAAWKSLAMGILNLVGAVCLDGGVGKMLNGLRSGPRHVLMASSLQCLQQLGYTVAYVFTDPSTAMLLISLNPLWAGILGWIVLQDALPRRTIGCLAFACFSVLIVFLPQLHGGASEGTKAIMKVEDADPEQPLTTTMIVGDCVALLTGVSVASYITVVRHASNACGDASMGASAGIGALAASLVAFGAAATAGAPLVDGINPFTFSLLLGICAVFLAVGYVMLALAPRFITGAEVATVMLLQMLLTPMLVYWGMGEKPMQSTIVGGALLIVTLVVHEAYGIVVNSCEDKVGGSRGGPTAEQVSARSALV